jgi:3-deoxy-manno-octulosonate cytidylyltransferase (CMP-KDO synthetase)
MNIKVVIPARYGSNNKPVYCHVVQRVIEAGIEIDNIVVTTDDQRIVDSAVNEGVPVQLSSINHVRRPGCINEIVLLEGGGKCNYT